MVTIVSGMISFLMAYKHTRDVVRQSGLLIAKLRSLLVAI
jgi:hypothetical protein